MRNFIAKLFKHAIALTLFATPLLADPSSMPDNSSLSSTDASYDGNSLVLTGHVVLDHGLGKMMAEEAHLQKQEAGKDFPFSLIQLRKDVLLALKNSAKISCGSADLDFTALKGILHPSESSKVVYSDQVKKKKGDTVPLKLSGQLIELSFSKHAHDDKKTEYEVQNILAKEDVVIDYADHFELQAGQAIYRRELSNDKSAKREFQGIVTAYPKEGSPCHLSHQGDKVDAEMIDLDLINSTLSLLHAKGILNTSLIPSLQKGDMQFSTDHLYWDHGKNTLTLKGHIFIDEPALGTLNAQDELHIIQSQVKGKTVLKTLHAQGPATLVYKDDHHSTHQLVSQGTIYLERDKLLASIDSPETEGVISPDMQLYYEENEMAIFADNALLEYSIAEDKLLPTTLSLKGNIRLFSHDPQKPLRCGIADRLTYSLMTRTVILAASPGKKVLFWDETQGMHLSAPEVHITYDAQTKQQNVKGVGAVQFSFTPDEQSKLMQLFPQLKNLP